MLQKDFIEKDFQKKFLSLDKKAHVPKAKVKERWKPCLPQGMKHHNIAFSLVNGRDLEKFE